MSSVSGGAAATAFPGARAAAWRDFAVVVMITVVTAILCVRFNVSEALLRWTRPHERFQLDELPGVLLVLAVTLIWFAVRRHREALREITLRRRAEASLSAALAENRRLAQQYLEIQESERRALARDLHDELGQYLNVVKVDTVAMRERFARGDGEGHRLAAETIGNINRIQAVVMGLIRQLRPVGLDELGLVAAIEHCVEEWRRRLPQLTIELTVTEDLEGLDEMRRLALYRLVQEGLTNVARHSRATRVEIRVAREPGAPPSQARVVVCVEDNGVGAEPAHTGPGLGLIGMRERMEAVGGSLQVGNREGGGFRLRAEVPVGSGA
jgi:two-component system, NarL family, sensor histidine kinase UhpB